MSHVDGESGGRTMVFGSRGFTRGVHYWEVTVKGANWGGVFIGVASDEASSWNGYGLLNYRATQAYGNETLYGSYFAVNDRVGVMLDMDHGTLYTPYIPSIPVSPSYTLSTVPHPHTSSPPSPLPFYSST